MISRDDLLKGNFVEHIVWFADGSTASLSEFDGVVSRAEAEERAGRISLREGRGSVVKVFRSQSGDG